MDKVVHLDDTLKEIRNKYRSRVPKNHSISNVIGDVNERVATRRQSRKNKMGLRINEMGLTFYTSQMEPKNVEEALGDKFWTTALQE